MASAKRLRRRRKQFDGKGLMAIRLAFARQFGRLPQGDDPVFFDPDAHQPHSLPEGGMQRHTLEAMLENRTAPHLVYTYCRTGFAVSEATRSLQLPELLFRWDMAIGEYMAFNEKASHRQH